MARGWKKWAGPAVFLAVAGLALAQAGCLAVAAGAAAAGGAAVGYAYVTAPMARDYPVAPGDAAAATRAALADLQLPLVNEKNDGGVVTLESRTGDDSKVVVTLEPVSSRVPADGTLTHVAVRVGHFGDDAVSARIHDQINQRVMAPAAPGGRLVPQPQPSAQAARPAETAPPPLAGAAPIQPAKHETKQP
jgi:hypothetical protein